MSKKQPFTLYSIYQFNLQADMFDLFAHIFFHRNGKWNLLLYVTNNCTDTVILLLYRSSKAIFIFVP